MEEDKCMCLWSVAYIYIIHIIYITIISTESLEATQDGEIPRRHPPDVSSAERDRERERLTNKHLV